MPAPKWSILMLCVLSGLSICGVQANEPTSTTTLIEPEIPPGNLQQQVAVAMRQSRQDLGLLLYLVEKKPDETLPLLEPYMAHSDFLIRRAVVEAAARAATAKAINMLVVMTGDQRVESVAADAITALFIIYCNQRIHTLDEPKLEDNLVKHIQKGSRITSAILLLSCFKKSTKLLGFLSSYSRNHLHDYAQMDFTGVLPRVGLGLCITMTLAELGNAGAQNRLSLYIADADPGDLIFILSGINFINRKETLLQLVETIKDKRVFPQSISDVSASRPLRICDVALGALKYKSTTKQIYPFFVERVADEDILPDYERLKTMFSNFSFTGSGRHDESAPAAASPQATSAPSPLEVPKAS